MRRLAGNLGKGTTVLASAAALLLGPACGGGGGAMVIPPFWVWDQAVVRDLDGDGRADVAVPATLIDGGTHRNSVQVFLRNAAGGFAAPTSYPLAFSPWGMSVGDLDGDGRPDLVVASPASTPPQLNTPGDSGGLAVLRQDPAAPGHFLVPAWIRTGGAPEASAVTDLTGDGRADVADGARQVAIGDLNSDGLPDVAVISLVYQSLSTPSKVTILLQSAAQRGAFAVGGVMDGTQNANFIALGDVDGDGRTDLVLNEGPSVMVQTAPGTFSPPRTLR